MSVQKTGKSLFLKFLSAFNLLKKGGGERRNRKIKKGESLLIFHELLK